MARFSAQEIFKIGSEHQLTSEQIAAIEHVGSSALVVAGAGSGKTELMSIRAMYLVANELARPSEILGLTFTRKAALELSNRIQQGLFRLRETPYWPKSLGDEFEPAKVATYNSFGNEIFRELALSLGYEADATLITEAMSISLVKELLKSINLQDFPALQEFEKTESYLISLVLAANSQLTDNLVSAESAIGEFESFVSLAKSLPQKEGGSMNRFAYTDGYIAQAELNQLIFALAGEYQRLKAERNLVDFSDQVALAYLALDKNSLNLGYRQVMLDEYQDTSAIQTMLLSKLFRQSEVMAVGDPNQSIYGWRGASSANLESFAADFDSGAAYSLSKSWRSSSKIVAAANQISSELPSGNLNPIALSAGRDFPDQVEALVLADEISEASKVAEWIKARLDSQTSAAILFRSKSAMGLFTEQLSLQGIDFEVTGLSGLTDQPEVIDLIAALRVMVDPNSATHLLRLLAGPRFRIAPVDIAQLQRWSREISKLEDGSITLVEALDQLRWRRDLSRAKFSQDGESRLKSAADLIHRMRQQLGLSLVELCWSVVQELELDIELYAHSNSKNPLGNLQAFISRIADYEQSATRPSLSGMISWLDYALEHESFELPKSNAKKGVVQLMTIHAAKGLEWDLVVVASMVDGAFPVGPKDTTGWLAAGKLPFTLRKDKAALPKLDLKVTTQKELDASIKDFKVANRTHQLIEERRLAYVAVTRPSKALLLTASYYKFGNTKPRPVASFLTGLVESSIASLLEEVPEIPAENPLSEITKTQVWPVDPLGAKRSRMEDMASEFSSVTPASISDSLELAALVEELDAGIVSYPEVPVRLSASRIVQLITNPESFFEQTLRPMPQLYDDSAELGSRFHASVEEAFLAGSELDFSGWAEDEKELGRNFQDSRFSQLEPFAIELPIEFSLGGTVVVCKLDAVFETEAGYLIVDWKSGSTPDKKSLESRAIQLAIYRVALARKLALPIERIRASFFFAADGKEVMPDLMSEAELEEKLKLFRTVRHQP